MLELPDKILHNGVDLKERNADERLLVAYAIALWYNGATFVNDDKKYHIGCSPPPKLRTLLGVTETTWRSEFEPVLQLFQNNGVLKEETILRRKVSWVPTQKFRETMGEIFTDYIAEVASHSSFNSDVGLVGDWNESLIHRMGVERLEAVHERRGRHTEKYPTVGNEVTPDIYWWEPAGFENVPKYQKWGGEVLTDHNNSDLPRRKYQAFASSDTKFIWVFEDRAHAALTLTHLDSAANLDCSLKNTPYLKPGNYSIKVLNKYIQDSKDDPNYSCSAIQKVTTLTALDNRISEPHGTPGYLRPPSDRNPVIVS